MFGQTYYFTPIFELDGKNVKTFKLAYGDPNVGDSYMSSYFSGLVNAVEPCCKDCPANVDPSGTYCVSIFHSECDDYVPSSLYDITSCYRTIDGTVCSLTCSAIASGSATPVICQPDGQWNSSTGCSLSMLL